MAKPARDDNSEERSDDDRDDDPDHLDRLRLVEPLGVEQFEYLYGGVDPDG